MTTIHVSVRRITLRRSRISPMAPAGRAKMKNGSADAVCVRATYIGPALRDTMSQAAPTLCIKVPTSETTSATSRLRNVDDRRGCQRLAGASLFAFAMWVVSPRYQHLFGADSCEWDFRGHRIIIGTRPTEAARPAAGGPPLGPAHATPPPHPPPSRARAHPHD